jgi:hypothetical protein
MRRKEPHLLRQVVEVAGVRCQPPDVHLLLGIGCQVELPAPYWRIGPGDQWLRAARLRRHLPRDEGARLIVDIGSCLWPANRVQMSWCACQIGPCASFSFQ